MDQRSILKYHFYLTTLSSVTPASSVCICVLKGTFPAEPRKHTILPRNHDNFSEASYFFSEEFYTLWSFSPRIGGTYHFRSSFFHTFVFNLWKNQAEYSISVVKYQIFLLFIKIFLGTRFLGSSKNLDHAFFFSLH